MTTLNTLEELTTQAVGTPITIGGQTYTATATGLTRDVGDGAVAAIPFAEFVGSLAAGQVTTGVRLAANTWLTTTRTNRYYYLTDGAREGQWRVVAFAPDGAYHSHLDHHPNNLEGLVPAERMPWMTCAESAARQIARLVTERDEALDQPTPPVVHTLDPAFISAMHEALNSDEIDRDSSMDDVLRQYGQERGAPEAEVDVDVMIVGCTTLDLDAAERLVNESRLVDLDGEVEMTWRHRATITVTGREGECACEQIDRDSVEQWLSEHDVSWSSFDYEVEDCEHC